MKYPGKIINLIEFLLLNLILFLTFNLTTLIHEEY